MSFVLTSDRLERLGAAMRAVLAPVGDGGQERWCREVVEATRALVDADFGSVIDPGGRGVVFSSGDAAMVREYQEYYAARDLGTREILRRRLEVGHLEAVGRLDERMRSEFYTGFVVPNGLSDGMSVNAFSRRGPSLRVQVSWRGRRLDSAELERNEALLRALAPAVRAAADAFRSWGRDARRVGTVLDALPGALALCGGDGAVVHRNPALEALLAGDSERARVMGEVEAVARRMWRLLRGRGAADEPAGEAEVRTPAGRYELRAVQMEDGPAGALLAVTLRFSAARVVPDDRLRERFGLTEREAEVARALAQGLSNAQLAHQLVMSPHTARHHTERVLRKLGITNRAQVAGTLHGPESP